MGKTTSKCIKCFRSEHEESSFLQDDDELEIVYSDPFDSDKPLDETNRLFEEISVEKIENTHKLSLIHI